MDHPATVDEKIKMPFDIHAGTETPDLFKALLMLHAGMLTYWIPLNGGSETRAEVIEYWQEFARNNNLGFELLGQCAIKLRGDPVQFAEKFGMQTFVSLIRLVYMPPEIPAPIPGT
jgi:hypothetical protein